MSFSSSRRSFLRTLGAGVSLSTAGCLSTGLPIPGLSNTGFTTTDGTCPRPSQTQADQNSWPLTRYEPANTARAPPTAAPGQFPLEPRWQTRLEGDRLDTPLIVGETVLARRPAPDGTLTAVHATTGDTIWQHTRDELLDTAAIADNTIYTGYSFYEQTEGIGITTYALTTGTRQWETTDVGSTSHVVPVAEYLFLLTRDGLVGYRTETKSVCWRYRPKGPLADITDIAVRDGHIYAVTREIESDVPDSGHIIAIDPRAGVEWRVSLDGPAHAIAAGPDRVFTRVQGDVLAVDRADGRLNWRVRTNANSARGLALTENRVVFGGYYSLCAVDAATGDAQWRREYEAGNLRPAIAGDLIVATGENHPDHTGLLVAVSRTGEERWQTPIPGGAKISRPAIADGQIYVGTAHGQLIAFGTA